MDGTMQGQHLQANLAQAHAINPLEQPGVYGMALTSCRVQPLAMFDDPQ